MKRFIMLLTAFVAVVETFAQIDMGLPSELKWAALNLGAEKETDPGLYYTWGGIGGGKGRWRDYPFTEKYYSLFDYDKITSNLSLDHDAVHDKIWDIFGIWRMPTNEDYNELLENCLHFWVENYRGSGVSGELFLSKTSGKTLFFPAGGFIIGSEVSSNGEIGFYWSSTYGDKKKAYHLSFHEKGAKVLKTADRFIGCCIKGVRADGGCYKEPKIIYPQFPGGYEALMKYISIHGKFPQEAKEKQIGGSVIVEVVIETDGSITDPTILKSVHPCLDEEAIRIVQTMPKWTPAKDESAGFPVPCRYAFPVNFIY